MSKQNKTYIQSIEQFLKTDKISGILLGLCVIIALGISNSSWGAQWFAFWDSKVGITSLGLKKDLTHWVNDGLMAIFFLLVGLEIKREVVEGELSDASSALLPVSAAIGGMVVPALIYSVINFNTVTASGWGISMATDIAFALGVISILGNRVPFSLKIMLTALAIVDDLGAILVIALFYSSDLSLLNLGLAFGTLVVLVALNKFGVKKIFIYLLVGAVLWYFTLKSGVHASIAGVLLAFTIPLGKGQKVSAAERLEYYLHKLSTFLIMPIFALANTGFVIPVDIINIFATPMSMGIILGLLIGKPLGIVLFSWAAVKAKFAQLPVGINWLQVLGVGFLGGIGYTMSIFISLLAFSDPTTQSFSKAAILVASVSAGVLGYFILRSKKASATNAFV